MADAHVELATLIDNEWAAGDKPRIEWVGKEARTEPRDISNTEYVLLHEPKGTGKFATIGLDQYDKSYSVTIENITYIEDRITVMRDEVERIVRLNKISLLGFDLMMITSFTNLSNETVPVFKVVQTCAVWDYDAS